MSRQTVVRRILKPLVFLASLIPFAQLAWGIYTFDFINPISELTLATGDWTIRFVCITLAITPLRRISGWHDTIKFRRMFGLFAFFYGCLHFTIYLLDRFLVVTGVDVATVIEDIVERPYITVGFAGFLAMAPLALTSTSGWIRRLGGKTWRRLHRLVYFTAVAGVLHYWWLVKSDVREPMIYAGIVGVLFAVRVQGAYRRRVSRPPAGRVDTGAVRRPS